MLTCFNALAAAPIVCAEECVSSLIEARKRRMDENRKEKRKKGKKERITI
jgi:hypothetical protein